MYPRFRTRCTQRTRHGRSRLTGTPQRWAFDDLSPLHMQAQRQGWASRPVSKGMHAGHKSEMGAVKFRVMFHKFGKKFGKFRVPTRRRRRRDGSRVLGSILWRERASCCSAVVARCEAGRWQAAQCRRVRIIGRGASVRLQMVGLGATRPCVLDGRREPQMPAAWRRPPR